MFEANPFYPRDTVYAATWRVSCAVFKAYRLREDAENAYNRALNRGAVIQYEQRDEPEHEAPVGTSIQPVTSNFSLMLTPFSTSSPWP